MYVNALMRDLDRECSVQSVESISSIFIGGGTPSLFSGNAINALLDGISNRLTLTDDVEITLEANPGSADASRFKHYKTAGVNRISIGIQSFSNACLTALGRAHNAVDSCDALDAAVGAGFDNMNIDLMFGLPSEDSSRTLKDLSQAISFNPQHISWYQLTIEENTAFAKKPPMLPSHDEICDEYEAGQILLTEAGFSQYEISAYSKQGSESRHNLNYWNFGDYVGIGAGAHGKRASSEGVVRTEKIKNPDRYMQSALSNKKIHTDRFIAEEQLIGEYMINALRLKNGFCIDALLANIPKLNLQAHFFECLDSAYTKNFLQCEDRWVKPTPLGYRFLNDLQLIFL
jgi:putative oxygen-independent coproporphyrinogen III oxidase